MTALIALIGLLGLAVGSFLTIVIARVPGCRRVIGKRYRAVELVTALLFVAVTAELAADHRLALAPALLYFTALGVALSAIDLEVHRLPNALVLPSYPVLAGLLALGAGLAHDPALLVRAAIGAAGLGVAYFAIAFAWPGGMGFGDVKFAGLVGAVLGALSYRVLVVGAAAAFLLGAVVGLVLLAARRGSRRTAVPFGPFMVAGSLVALFLGAPLADTYVRLALRA